MILLEQQTKENFSMEVIQLFDHTMYLQLRKLKMMQYQLIIQTIYLRDITKRF